MLGIWHGERRCLTGRELHSPSEAAVIVLLLLIFLKRDIGRKASGTTAFTQLKSVTEKVTLQHFQLLRLLSGTTEACTIGEGDGSTPTSFEMASKPH